MEAILTRVEAILETLLSWYLPSEIYAKLDAAYSLALMLLGAGAILLLASVVCILISVGRIKRRQALLNPPR